MRTERNVTKKERVKAKNRKNGIPRITCPDCGAGTRIATAGEVYRGAVPFHIRELLVCEKYPECDCYVGINRKFRRYGLPANRKVRLMRFAAHRLQDSIVERGLFTRDELYSRMCSLYGLPRSKAHLRYFDEDMCHKVILDYRNLLEGNKNGNYSGKLN